MPTAQLDRYRDTLAESLALTQKPPILRLYSEQEMNPGAKGYPLAWGRCVTCRGTGWLCACCDGPQRPGHDDSSNGCPTCLTAGSAKALVRELAGHRCVRCQHPYVCGESDPKWSECDERCIHGGPFRAWSEYGDEIRLRGEAADALALLRCGDASVVKSKHRVLTVHHLQTGHAEKLDCRWWNLAALCQRCHLTIQGKVQMHRAWPWEHSEWFRPYVAGFYAWKYGGVDLSRTEVESELDALLEMGQVEESVERMAA